MRTPPTINGRAVDRVEERAMNLTGSGSAVSPSRPGNRSDSRGFRATAHTRTYLKIA
jgi:hypothetical protein